MAIFHMSFSNISAGKDAVPVPVPLIEVAKNYSIKKKVEAIFMLGRLCQKALF